MNANHVCAWSVSESQLRTSMLSGQQFENLCEHPQECYLGSFQYVCNVGDTPLRADVYVYTDFMSAQQVCLRVGNEGSDYVTVGTVLDLLIRAQQIDASLLYQYAAALIDAKMKIRGVRI